MSGSSPSIFERLLAKRIVCLGTDIDDYVANAVIAQLLYLESQDRTRDITLYLNSPGGVVTSALAIHDVMTSIAPPVATGLRSRGRSRWPERSQREPGKRAGGDRVS